MYLYSIITANPCIRDAMPHDDDDDDDVTRAEQSVNLA